MPFYVHCTKHDPALPTESYVPLDCFISTQCFRESLPSSEYIINYKNSQRDSQTGRVIA